MKQEDRKKLNQEISLIKGNIDLKEAALKNAKNFDQGYFLTLADIRNLKVKLEGKKRQLQEMGDRTVRDVLQIPTHLNHKLRF